MRPFLSQHYGNPSSHHWAGAPAKPALEKARNQLAARIRLFTAGNRFHQWRHGGNQESKLQGSRTGFNTL
jgi:hypothetical protein